MPGCEKAKKKCFFTLASNLDCITTKFCIQETLKLSTDADSFTIAIKKERKNYGESNFCLHFFRGSKKNCFFFGGGIIFFHLFFGEALINFFCGVLNNFVESLFFFAVKRKDNLILRGLTKF